MPAVAASAAREKPRAAAVVDRFRDQFPILAKSVYLDTARRSAAGEFSAGAAREWLEADREARGSKAFDTEGLEAARRECAALLGSSADEVAFTRNTTDGLNIALDALALSSGQAIAIPAGEYPGLLAIARALRARGVEVREVKVDESGRIDPGSLETVLKTSPRALLFSWVNYSSGARADLETIGALCRKHEVVSVIDGMQAVGFVEPRLAQQPIDILAVGSHKGLLAPPGIGLLYVRRSLIESLRPRHGGLRSLASGEDGEAERELPGSARRFEHGTPNYLGVALLRTGVRVLRQVGTAKIERYVAQLTARFLEGASATGLAAVTPQEPGQRAHIATLDLGERARGVSQRLASKGVVLSRFGSRLRFSFGAYSTIYDVDDGLTALREALG